MRPPPDERNADELLAFGVVNLDKPPGPSAHQVAGWVRDLADVERAAHAGTLDPKVTGCLPVLLGDATRTARVFLEGRKEYVAVLELHGSPPADLRSVVGEFVGDIYQKPPRKSAVVRRLRTREVADLTVEEVDGRQVLLRLRCESGTYVRKLCHDIGLALGTGAHMGELRRVGTEPFDDTDLHTLQDLADGLVFADEGDESLLRAVVSPAERALSHLPRVTVAPSAAEQVAEGAPVYAPGVLDVSGVHGTGGGGGERDDGGERYEGEHDDNGDAGGDGSLRGNDDCATNAPLVACYTPAGTAVCLGRLVGDPGAECGTVVDLERVLV